MKKTLFFVLISLISCTSNTKENEVVIFNDISFKLLEGEKSSDNIDPKSKQNYLSYFKNTELQIPLLRSIKNKDYTIYLGIPYNTSISDLTNLQILREKSNLKSLKTDSKSFLFRKQNNDSIYFSEYVKVFDENLIYILTTTVSETISDSLFNITELSGRLIQN